MLDPFSECALFTVVVFFIMASNYELFFDKEDK